MDDLRRRLERLSERGTPRGARQVLADARGENGRAPRTIRLRTAVAVTASVALVAAGVGAVLAGRGGHRTPPLAQTGPGQPIEPISATRLERFDGCDGLLAYIRSQAADVVTPYGLPGGGGAKPMPVAVPEKGITHGPMAASDAAAGASGGVAGGAASTPAFSTTNVQEAGVDEPDTMKTDGHRIFAIARGRLWAVSADATPRILGSVPVENGGQLLVTGNRAIVLGAATGGGPVPVGPVGGSSTVTVVDVSDPGAMKVTGSLQVDGAYVDARLVHDTARIVFTSTPRIRFGYPQAPDESAPSVDQNKQAIQKSTIDDWVPHYHALDGGGRPVADGRLVDCNTSFRPPQLAGFGMVTVLTFDADHPEQSKPATVMADGNLVYASASSLYVATNQWGRVHDQIVDPVARTLVHRFDISDPKAATYKASGEVRGTALNQFSMSEDRGRFRIATTDMGTTSESFVTVLEERDGELRQVGQVGGLGRGERIYAVRFIGDRAYVVTFRQTDPLAVIDLADPTKPRVAGQLELEGYSAYLHPAGDHLLIGVGQDATSSGRTQGAQVSLFDVSDPSAPKLLQRHSLGGGPSAVEQDHHAFLYWEPTHLAVVPVMQVGAVGLKVDRGSISEVGRVTHPGSFMSIDRSAVIGDRVFTLSGGGVMASDLTSLAQKAWVPFG